FGRDSVVVLEAPSASLAPPTQGAVDAAVARYALPECFVLHLGNIEPRKDLATLARACAVADVALVVAGGAINTADVPNGAGARAARAAARRSPPVGAASRRGDRAARAVVGAGRARDGGGLPQRALTRPGLPGTAARRAMPARQQIVEAILPTHDPRDRRGQ